MSEYEFKGTKGPWLKVTDSPFVYALNENGVNQFQLSVQGVYCGDEEKQANAQAIAAVPELIEALRVADELISEKHYTEGATDAGKVAIDQIRAALDKATGERTGCER